MKKIGNLVESSAERDERKERFSSQPMNNKYLSVYFILNNG
jgi:hypothetical protein